jgi:hypothetical protein
MPRPIDTNEREDKEQTMNILLWILQAALAFLYISGGAYKVFKFDQLANHMHVLSRGGWRVLGEGSHDPLMLGSCTGDDCASLCCLSCPLSARTFPQWSRAS